MVRHCRAIKEATGAQLVQSDGVFFCSEACALRLFELMITLKLKITLKHICSEACILQFFQVHDQVNVAHAIAGDLVDTPILSPHSLSVLYTEKHVWVTTEWVRGNEPLVLFVCCSSISVRVLLSEC
jgi:hypothetical protein